jgi:hypothetical protein
MKISRIALLSAILFVGQYTLTTDNTTDIANANNQGQPAQQQAEVTQPVGNQSNPAAKTGILAAIIALPALGKDKVLNSLDFIASYSFTPVLNKLATFECLKGGKFQNSIPVASRVLVSGLLFAGMYKAYSLYNAQEDDNDDMIFDTEYDDNN